MPRSNISSLSARTPTTPSIRVRFCIFYGVIETFMAVFRIQGDQCRSPILFSTSTVVSSSVVFMIRSVQPLSKCILPLLPSQSQAILSSKKVYHESPSSYRDRRTDDLFSRSSQCLSVAIMVALLFTHRRGRRLPSRLQIEDGHLPSL